MEMTEPIVDRTDNGGEEQDVDTHTTKIFNKMGISKIRQQGHFKWATVCLGVLCVILLAVIISHKLHSSHNKRNEALQKQTLDNLTHEIVQLQSWYNNLTKDKDLIQTLFNNLTFQKSQLENKFKDISKDKEMLQTNYTDLSNEKSQLQSSYNNLTRDRDHIQTLLNNLTFQMSQLEDKFINMTKDKEMLQTNYSNLHSEKSQLQSSYNNLSRERDELQRQRETLVSWRVKNNWIRRKSSLYRVSVVKKSWNDSRRSCLNLGADLVVVNDEDEQQFIAKYKNHWIGLSDTEEEGVWRWVDGTLLTNLYWAPGEPNGIGQEEDEDCVEISSEATEFGKAWNDISCSAVFQYICEDHI